MKIKVAYFDNSDLCGECTGHGCKQCGYKGTVRFPLSFLVNGVRPHSIAQPVTKPRK